LHLLVLISAVFLASASNVAFSPLRVKGSVVHPQKATNTTKVALLGTCESGKSTIAHQLLLLAEQGFPADLTLHAQRIHQCLIQNAQTLVRLARDLGLLQMC
jgi:hypothetical protein